MRIQNVRVELLYKHDNLIITLPKGQENEIIPLIGSRDLEKDYEVSITERKKKRSLDANAYFWILCRKLAEKLKISEKEVYRKIISEVGAYELMAMKDDVIPRFIDEWEKNGLGWICQEVGALKAQHGYSWVRAYYGSSRYNTAEMARLIDGVINECNEVGIPTMTPDEIERLKMEWTG